MRTISRVLEIRSQRSFVTIMALATVIAMLLGYAHRSFAQKSGPKTFASAAEACHALHQAVRNNDEQQIEAILGAGKDVTSEGDEAADKLDRDLFLQKFDEMHRLVKEPDGTTVLYIGAENWPFPLPLVASNGRWFFDADAGKDEILFRRIGENEETAIETCRALTGGQKMPNGEGEQSGQPFHGYYFRPVQGLAKAAATAQPGVAFVAYPAKYRSSGVLTFIVTSQGAVYERDLGAKTETLAPTIKQQSGQGWELVKD